MRLFLILVAIVAFAVLFNIWLAYGCNMSSGYITWQGKACAF